MKLANRMQSFTSFIVMDILERAIALEEAGHNVVHMEVGEPDFELPAPVGAAMVDALMRGETHYTHSLGTMALREAISRNYLRIYGVEVDPQRICVTTGTSAAFVMLFGALLNPGDRLAMTDPGYPCYANDALLVGASTVRVNPPLPDGSRTPYCLTTEVLEENDLTGVDLFLVSSPSNPTGMLTDEAVYRWLLERDIPVISDEIYGRLVYEDATPRTALSISDDIIVVDGFSKAFAMTGCRLGWIVAPPELVGPLNRIAQNLYLSPPSVAQWGAIAALEQCDDHLEEMRSAYSKRRERLMVGLEELGLKVAGRPRGAFYLFADVSRYDSDSLHFCRRMLDEAHVAATPGVDFGKNGTQSFVRFAYTRDLGQLEEGLARLRRWLPTL